MGRTRYCSVLGLLLLAGALAPARADGPDWFPFVIPWDGDGPGAPDVGTLNPGAAGDRGFITARDGHFYDEKGGRVRFLGVNISVDAAFPAKAVAAKVAPRLRKYGINIVRLHSIDAYHSPRGIFDRRYKDTQHLDPDQLDRLDYLIAQLKKNGIYINFNLHVGRAFTPGDGVAETDRLGGGRAPVAYFHPRMIELQKKYARDLLTHRNPYTKTRYVDDPAIAVVELTNENTLFSAEWGENLHRLPPTHRGELARQWNSWLNGQYGSTAALKRAWGGPALAAGSVLRNGDFAGGTDAWRLEKHEGARATHRVADGIAVPDGAKGRTLRLEIAQAGKEAWHIQLQQPGLDLKDDAKYTVTFWARADRKRQVMVSAGLDQDNYRSVGLASPQTVDDQWRRYTATFTATKPLAGHTRLVFGLGTAGGTVDLAGIVLEPSGGEGFPGAVSLENGTVPLGKRQPGAVGRDWLAFLLELERRYLATLRDYLQKDLGMRASVSCSQASYGGLAGTYRERLADYADMHAYWQHPHYPRRLWDAVDWDIPNTPMARDRAGGTLAGIARHRLAGKPFCISEYSHPAPNEYQAEALPMVASFAALQDWDAVYLFDYHSERGNWDSERIRGHFSMDSNPAQVALLPAAAMLFRRGDVPPAKGECQLRIPQDGIIDLLATTGKGLGEYWDKAGDSGLEGLKRRVSLAFVPGADGKVAITRTGPAPEQGPIRWTDAGTDRALYTVDTPRSKAMVGFLGGRQVTLPGWKVAMAKTDNNFATLALTALDDNPIDRSRSLLLTAVGRVENKGMVWNAKRDSIGDKWGDGPTRAEGIPATVTVDTQAKSATVHALDGSGRRRVQVDARLADGRLTFAIGPAHKTLWYEIQIVSGPLSGN